MQATQMYLYFVRRRRASTSEASLIVTGTIAALLRLLRTYLFSAMLHLFTSTRRHRVLGAAHADD
jgi:hypothetical protein